MENPTITLNPDNTFSVGEVELTGRGTFWHGNIPDGIPYPVTGYEFKVVDGVLIKVAEKKYPEKRYDPVTRTWS